MKKHMIRMGFMVGMGALAVALAGCNHSSSTGEGARGAGVVSNATGPAKPAATADDNVWGRYLADLGELHGKDVGMRPYVYVIPGGDSVTANARRQEEIDSIVHSIGPVLMPGGMLILGGPQAKQTTAFITVLSKQIKADSMKGIVVMVVSDPAEQDANTAALKPSGAVVRFVSM